MYFGKHVFLIPGGGVVDGLQHHVRLDICRLSLIFLSGAGLWVIEWRQ